MVTVLVCSVTVHMTKSNASLLDHRVGTGRKQVYEACADSMLMSAVLCWETSRTNARFLVGAHLIFFFSLLDYVEFFPRSLKCPKDAYSQSVATLSDVVMGNLSRT
jgi:hypothetical protein